MVQRKRIELGIVVLLTIILSASLISATAIIFPKGHVIRTYEQGAQVAVPVWIRGADMVYAYDIDASYDNPAVIDYNSLIMGSFLTKDGDPIMSWENFPDQPKVGSGYVNEIIATITGDQTNGVTGDGLLFTIMFDKLGDGNAKVTLNPELMTIVGNEGQVIADFDVYYLTIWDDADQGNTIVASEAGMYYATLEDSQSNPIATTCQLTINNQVLPMSYSNGVYSTSATFDFVGTYDYSVECDNFYSGTARVTVSDCRLGMERQCGGEQPADTCKETIQACTGQVWGNCFERFIDPIPDQCNAYITTSQEEFGGVEYLNVIYKINKLSDVMGYESVAVVDEAQLSYNDLALGEVLTSYVGQAEPFPIAKANPNGPGLLHAGIIIPPEGVQFQNDMASGTLASLKYEILAGGLTTISGLNTEILSDTATLFTGDLIVQVDVPFTGCTPGETRVCGSDIGECSTGLQTCLGDGSWDQTCAGEVTAIPEICDTLDNNCNGVADEDNVCTGEDSDNDGVLNANDFCPRTRPNTPINPKGCNSDLQFQKLRLIKDVSLENLQDIADFEVEDIAQQFGKILFKNNINLMKDVIDGVNTYLDVLPLDIIIIIEDNKVSVDSTLAPLLNVPARVTISRLYPNGDIPTDDKILVLKDGTICGEPQCIIFAIRRPSATKLEVDVDVASFSEITLGEQVDPSCGDNVCNGGETCSTCSGDCGSCAPPPPPSSGGGGGGGGGLSCKPKNFACSSTSQCCSGYACVEDKCNDPPKTCSVKWVCEPWDECQDGIQTRNCRDVNNCGSTNKKPVTKTTCANTCFDGIQNGNEQGIDCGGSCTRECEEYLAPLEYERFKILTDETELKKSRVTIYYDNRGEGRKSGVYFKILLKNEDGKLVTEEYLGPLTIDEEEEFTKIMTMPFYLLSEGENFKLEGEIFEKGSDLEQYNSSTLLTDAPINMFILRLIAAFAVVGLLVVVTASIFARYMKR
ncbi:hypothetical protein GOV09_01710 [Candidatus Woesearchaeota archaeon]|nr:hypothetical protein [Candidatus Woesearchaeota archaeon]